MTCQIQIITVLCLLLVTTGVTPAQDVDDSASLIRFNRDIRPILSDKCFQCHGPDAKSREAELRLDERHDAVADRGGNAAVVAGKAADSGIMRRILTDDPDVRMPPAATGKSLSPREIALLRAWIDQGATYQEHWSFLPVADVDPPVLEPHWSRQVRNPIDQFVFRKLQREDVSPSLPADSHTLIRRMSLDLIGLLPAPGIVDSFAAQYATNAENAVQGFTQELLNSPHHGERWGRYWLDQARYADSHGYTIDGDRVMWPYRDWVIRAINDDMPFDRFTIEQLAGDLLPDPSKPQLVATGFHRNTLINQEGGTDNEQFRNEEVVDRVNTTGAVWLGLTLGCAQCHSHKFDPVSQKEFYQFFAFFNHTADVNNVGPTVDVSEGELLQSNSSPQLQAELDDAKSALADLTKAKSNRQAEWVKTIQVSGTQQPAAEWKLLIATELHAEGGAKLRTLDDQSILAAQGAPMETYTVTFPPTDTPIAALRLRVLTHDSLPKSGPGRASNGNFVLSRVEVLVGGKAVTISHVQSDHDQPGFPASNIVDGNARTGWAINIGKGSRAGVKMNAPHEAHLVFAEPVISGAGPLTMILRHEVNANYNVGHFAVDASATAPASVLHEQLLAAVGVPADKRTAEHKKLIASEFTKVDREQQKAESRVNDLREKMGLGQTVKTMVMRELDQARETYVHIRGDFLRKDKDTGLLQPDVPRVLPSLPGENRSRLDLARWLVSKENPLTARVTVNRVWMRYFGRGLVETENDFGTQGSFPTHPELLDWLAGEFMDSGWSMKKLHELIVTSATYRQASHRRSELDAVDPRNLLLGRQNRLRVDAEIVRDIGLSASGLLSRKIGGPSVRPPQPEGVYAFTQTRKKWTTDAGDNRYRRALYTYFYRSAPYPMLTTFDAPDFQSVCTGRPRSNTPLQSLTMANDKAFFEMAQGLAERLMSLVDGTDAAANKDRIREAFRICYARLPTSAETELVSQFQQHQMSQFKADSKAATKVAPRDHDESYPVEVAASWTAVARAMMNADEFVTRE
jgi:hypothetical protein